MNDHESATRSRSPTLRGGSSTPRLRAIEAMAVGLPGLLLSFATPALGLVAAPVGLDVRWLALLVRPRVVRRRLVVSPMVGLAVAGLAVSTP